MEVNYSHFGVLGASFEIINVLTLGVQVFATSGKRKFLAIERSAETLIPLVTGCPRPKVDYRSDRTVSGKYLNN